MRTGSTHEAWIASGDAIAVIQSGGSVTSAIPLSGPFHSTNALSDGSACDAPPAAFEDEPVTPEGIALGTPVLVIADEYGSGHVAGELAPSGLHEIAVRRRGERAGEVVVHFPRDEFTLIATG